MFVELGAIPSKIREQIMKTANWLFQKKQNKIPISSVTPPNPEENDVWIDMSDNIAPPSHPINIGVKLLEVEGSIQAIAVNQTLLTVDVIIQAPFNGELLAVDGTLYDKSASVDLLDIDCIMITDWMLTSGAKTYDRVYLNHFRAAYYGYYAEPANYNQSDKYKPIPIGKLDTNIVKFGSKSFTVLALLGMYDERKEDNGGNGFGVLFAIDTPDGVIPFKTITISINYTYVNYTPLGTVIYKKTLLDSYFSTDDVHIRRVVWPDETNGAIPKLFEVLYDINRYNEPPVAVNFEMTTVLGETYNTTLKLEAPKLDTHVIDLPILSSNEVSDDGSIIMRKGYFDNPSIPIVMNGRKCTIKDMYFELKVIPNTVTNNTPDLYIHFDSDRLFTQIELSIPDIAGSTITIDTKDIVDDTYILTNSTVSNIWKSKMDTKTVSVKICMR